MTNRTCLLDSHDASMPDRTGSFVCGLQIPDAAGLTSVQPASLIEPLHRVPVCVHQRSTRELLTTRRELLVKRLDERDALIAGAGFPLPRATMLETEYLHATTEAEIRWLDSVLTGLDDGSISWSPREMREAAARLADN
jgi:hypothetical protein